MYLLWKSELENNRSYDNAEVKEIILYHATSVENAMKIACNNIDWRMTKRSRYGRGACFSPDPVYANMHANKYGSIYAIYIS